MPAWYHTDMTTEETRASCAKARDLMARGHAEKFAVGAFNLDNQETLIAVANALRARSRFVVVQNQR